MSISAKADSTASLCAARSDVLLINILNRCGTLYSLVTHASFLAIFSSRISRTVKVMLLFDAIIRHQFLRVGIILWHAGGGDVLAFLDVRGDLLVQGEELGEQILFRAEAVGVRAAVSSAACASFNGFAPVSFRCRSKSRKVSTTASADGNIAAGRRGRWYR